MSAPADVRGRRGGGTRGRTGGARGRAGRAPARVVPALSAVALLVGRGIRRDAALLAAWCAVVVVAVLVALGGPRVAEVLLDDAARDAVRAAGPDADVVVALRGTTPSGISTYRAEAVDEVRRPALRGVLRDAVAAFESRPLDVVSLDDVAIDGPAAAEAAGLPEGPKVLPALLDEVGAARVRAVDGSLDASPADDDAMPVALPDATAAGWGLGVGDVLELAGPETGLRPNGTGPVREPARVEVVAVVAPLDPADVAWFDAGPLWAEPAGRAPVPLLATADIANRVAAETGLAVNGVVRLRVDAERFSADVAARVVDELASLELGPAGVVPSGVATSTPVETRLGVVLADHLGRARAAAAQMSVPAAGVVGVVAVVLLLVARVLVERRRAVLELERARGASVGVAVARLGVESALVAAVATAAATGTVAWLLPGPTAVVPLAAVLVTALGATPLWGGRVARRSWSGVRQPANRRDRDRLARRRAAARLVAEAAVLALAAGAAAALRGRGLLQTTTRGTDPFLAAAPLLIGLGLTVLALRVYPGPVRLLAAVARRSPGVLGIVGAARARRALAPLPLLALTLAASVGVSGLLLVDTVRTGQATAAWQRVGAEVRITTPPGSSADAGLADVARQLRVEPGVTAASAGYLRAELGADLGNRDLDVSVLAVDDGYGDLVAAVPDAGEDLAAFAALADAEVTDGRLPAVVDARLVPRLGERGIALTVERVRWTLDVVGTTDHAPRGQAPGPFVYLPLDLLHDHEDAPVAATVVWAQGPGAADAATAAVQGLGAIDHAVVTRAGWLDERRGSALVSGVERMLLLGAGVAVALAVVGVVATVLGGSRERGRALALLRTLGMRRRLGWWLVLAELGPVVLAAALAGTGAGIAVVGLLGSALGLDVLAGGPDVPPVVVGGAVPALLAGGAVVLLLAAAAVEVAAHRRDRLSDVVRVGETPGS